MPVFRSNGEAQSPASESATTSVLLTQDHTGSNYCEVLRLSLPQGEVHEEMSGADSLVWYMVLSGSGRIGDEKFDASSVALAMPDTEIRIAADEDMDILCTIVPKAHRFDSDLATRQTGLRIVDWTREPVLQSEHDARTRVYVTTPGLAGTGAIKAEIITYPPGAAAPEHHHEGAEHFQFILSGTGTAVLNGRHQTLGPGDILYNFENELHYFFTDPAAKENLVFVEFFIPGHCKTVWAPEANACAWLPTGRDAKGGKPAREIGRHVHGEDSGL